MIISMTGMSCRVVSLKGPTNAARWGGVGPHTYNVDVTPAEGGAFLNLGLGYPKGCLPIVHKISLEHVIRQLAVAGLDMREDKAPGAAGTNRQPRSFDNMDSLFLRNIADHLLVMEQVKALDPVVQSAIECITRSLRDGGKVMFCGNGGSAADSQHLAAEFTGRFIEDRKPLAALALSTDTSALTCIGNDYSFDDVFARQVIGLGRPGDCLVGISTSGNSRNVLRAVEAAKAAGIACIGLLGRDGGELRQLCDLSIVVPSRTTARIQEAHILIGHTICGGVEIALGLAG